MSEERLSRTTFDTRQIAHEHRFEAWRGILGLTHDIDGASDDFHARVTSTAVGGMIVSEMTAAPQSVARSPQRVKRDGLDHIVLHVTSSAFDVETGDDRFHVPAGVVTVNTLSRAFRRSRAPEKDSLILSLSRDLVASVLPDPEMFHGQLVGGGIGQLLREHMRSLAQHAPSLSKSETEGLSRATAQLLAAGLEPTRSRLGAAQASREAAAIVRCKRYIEQHLASSDLTPDAICRDLGFSRSTLFRLFKASGGIGAYIRDRRLQAARNALAVPNRPRVSEVAYRYGFTNMAAFSRAFRAAYGISPRDIDSGIDRTVQQEGDVFTSWMRAVARGASGAER